LIIDKKFGATLEYIRNKLIEIANKEEESYHKPEVTGEVTYQKTQITEERIRKIIREEFRNIIKAKKQAARS
jgi:hypothetical protein